MSIENEIAGLTQSTTDLLEAVNTKKATLDTAVSNAQTAVTDATSQVSLAAAEKVGAQTARDTAESFKDQAYTYSQSAASAVAYQDLTAIAQTKAETAVDVFVYDTSKDSDGGAWRQRTQHTSWYNETLNTATRGSRKEFPAVAVIVAEADKVTIYDGDDPSMPMWMVFVGGTNHTSFIGFSTNGTVSSLTMQNGVLLVGTTGSTTNSSINALAKANFVSDVQSKYDELGYNVSPEGIYDRNNSTRGLWWHSILVRDTSKQIVNQFINDVAMTVLPDAPIDPATGLPIPTIAVATDGGVSVIKDDGTVVDITGYVYPNKFVAFDTEHFLYTTGNYYDRFRVGAIPASDISINSFGVQYLYKELSIKQGANFRKLNAVGKQSISAATENSFIALLNVDASLGTTEGVLSNIITSTYNTGWMNGDIKLATLSDTDDTDLVGTNLLSNGTFDSSTGWTTGAGWSISGGVATHNTSSGNSNLTYILALEVGKTYSMEFDVISTDGAVGIFTPTGGDMPLAEYISEAGKIVRTFTATATSVTVAARAFSGSTCVIDNFSVRIAEPDRSVNNNGLQVFGTVQKNPVATGADLVAYSGLTGYNVSANYLKQPYNPDLDFGTGDFCVAGWFKNGSGYLFDRTDSGDLGSRIRGFCTSSAIQFITEGGTININKDYTDGSWHFYCGLKKDGVLYLYVDSVLIGTASCASNLDNTDAHLVLGNRYDFNAPLINGSLALFRISGTAPTAEQIAKIYRDEKPLFQEGAQATLHGTSDAVTALAYDDTTELLHVGTSAGRSVFQGLRRVDNTTDAVGTAISASNGLVVEE